MKRPTMNGIDATSRYGHVESFSGPGGMSLGLERAGFTLLLAFDIDEPSVKTHCRNLRDRCIVADAARLSGKEILSRIGVPRQELALFAGGPPCQGFSKQKRGAHLGDDRNDLILEYLRLVKDLCPRFFLFENVAIFGQKRGREYLEEMKRTLTDYSMTPHFYNAADYGLAQTRERFVLVGRRNDQREPFRIPRPTVKKWRTVGDVLRGLPEPPEDYSDHPAFPNHQRARVTPINIERFSHVPQGGGWQNIPYDMRVPCHQDADPTRGGWPDVYGRLEWNGQCPTITGGFDSFTRGRYGHPLQDRPLTPREAARLQGFPDDFVFAGTRADVRSQIGNAVPPPVAEALGREIRRCLETHDGLREPMRRKTSIRQVQPSQAAQLQRKMTQTA
jgi:DNA (cytosine-5)-methyltransferase 1